MTGTDQVSIAAQVQQQQAAALQQQQLAAQQLLGAQAQSAGADTAAVTLDRKQREVYVGNLAIGVINGKLLEEFFNQALSHMVPDPVSAPPVFNVNMDGQGRFAFVEFRTRDLANEALKMDKLVEIYGRHLHIGRPKGYVEPTAPPLPLSLTGTGPAGTGSNVNGVANPTTALLLSNILPIAQLRNQEERTVLEHEVLEEALKYGKVEAVAVPRPPPSAQDRGPGRAYLLYTTVEDAIKGYQVFHTRLLDDNRIKAHYVQVEEFELARSGEWALRQHSVAGIPLPGLYTIAPVHSGVSGLTVLNPALASLVQANPSLAIVMTQGIDEDEVPFEEGWVKLRGFPPAVTKPHIVEFFKGCSKDLSEDDVWMVASADGTPLGEAFVRLAGPEAKLRLALARDKSPLPPVSVPAEVLTAFEGDKERRMLSGCQLL